jgi:hypothetical protein
MVRMDGWMDGLDGWMDERHFLSGLLAVRMGPPKTTQTLLLFDCPFVPRKWVFGAPPKTAASGSVSKPTDGR